MLCFIELSQSYYTFKSTFKYHILLFEVLIDGDDQASTQNAESDHTSNKTEDIEISHENKFLLKHQSGFKLVCIFENLSLFLSHCPG